MTSPPRKLINPLDPTTIHPFDVVFGKKTRGNFCAPGNKLFQRYLQSRRNEYAAEKRAIGKRSILESCIQDWRNITGGRFLLRDDSWWCDEIIFCKPKSRTTTDSVDNNQGETPDDYLLKKVRLWLLQGKTVTPLPLLDLVTARTIAEMPGGELFNPIIQPAKQRSLPLLTTSLT